jgi:hypothetical protein
VTRQLRTAGIMETVRIRKVCSENRLQACIHIRLCRVDGIE